VVDRDFAGFQNLAALVDNECRVIGRLPEVERDVKVGCFQDAVHTPA
jgi:hypothetical protein